MEPPAPAARLSITTGLPRIFSSAAAIGRAARSACPPGGKGTMAVMDRLGQASCATAPKECRPACDASDKVTPPLRRSRRLNVIATLPDDNREQNLAFLQGPAFS